MNKKMLHINNLNEISEMVSKVRKLNEAISFDEEYNYEEETPREEEFESHEEMEEETPCLGDECDVIDEMSDIDKIREITLRGMLKYSKKSNSPEYDVLKKIFQFCDKVNNEKTEDKE